MKIEKLSQHSEMVATVATWWFNEWSHLSPNPGTVEDAIQSLNSRIDSNEPLPYILVAIENGRIIGSASLKLQELRDHFPDKQYWLGSVYVEESARGVGVASALCQKIEEVAKSMNILTLNLATESLDGGLYARLDWLPVTQVNDRGDEVLVMNKHLPQSAV